MAIPEATIITNEELFPPADSLTLDQAAEAAFGGGDALKTEGEQILFNNGMQGE